MNEKSQTFHNRARESGNEINKLVISFSTAALGVFFLSLTKEFKPPLVDTEKYILIIATICFSIAVFSGILNLKSDAKLFYYSAKLIDSETSKDDSKDSYLKLKDRWYKIRNHMSNILYITFFLGIVSSSIFLFMRIIPG